jgi:Trk K+ transport system NAD-binding subunit
MTAWRREFRAGWRDTFILLKEFRLPLLIFIVTVLGGGLAYEAIAVRVGEPVESTAKAIFIIWSAMLFYSAEGFPDNFFLQLFHFFMPIVGLIIFARGLTDFGGLLFNRRARGREWEAAVASTMKNHTVLVGLGHLGYRIVQQLHKMSRSVVAIEQNPSIDTFRAVQKMKIPVIQEDATRPTALEAANVKSARTIILASQNDSMNLQIALKARTINPEIQVVIRIFDQDFAHELHTQFGFTALSATEMAAPVFAAAAAGADVTNPISIEGQQLSLARFTISPSSKLAHKTVGYVEDNYNLNVILLRHDQRSEIHPKDSAPLHPGDTLAVLGGPEQLRKLMQHSQ